MAGRPTRPALADETIVTPLHRAANPASTPMNPSRPTSPSDSTAALATAPPRAGPSKRGRRIGSVIAITGLALVAGLAWTLTHEPKAAAGVAAPGGPGGRGGPGGGRGAAATTVGIAVARQAAIPVLIEALGTVTPVANVTVRPQVSGVLTQVLFKEGQMVKKGDVLATIASESFRMAVAQAQGARVRDEAQLEAAQVTLARYRTLLAQDSIARQDVDTQAALVKQLEGTVTIDRANEGSAKLSLGYARITAPVGGRIGLRPLDAGNYIAAGDANGVAVITQLAPIDVAFSIPQDRVPEVQARMAEGAHLPVTAFDRTRMRRLDAGRFSTLDNLVDTTTGTVKAKARFANAEGSLFPNQFVNVRLLLRTISNAVVVPVTALRHGPNGDFVYVLMPDRSVALRAVTRGEASVEFVAITGGLVAGEQVVTEGADRLKDGARVQTAADRPPGAASGASAPGRRASGAGDGPGAGARERAGRAASRASGG
jgi:multidrug efflux system membrane fusion protein